MSIKRYIAEKDTTITDAYKEGFGVRAKQSNMGEADSLEVFSIYAQASTSSVEISRILVQFPIQQLVAERISGTLPASGSVKFFLRLFNVEHPFSVPRDFTLTINPVSKSWEEGYGVDLDTYTDNGFIANYGGYGATWQMAGSGSQWINEGSDYLTGSEYALSYSLKTGLEDIDLDITYLTEQWINGALPNNGLLIKLSSSQEDGSTKQSYYTKKFSARGSEFYMNRPCIEARWDPSIIDDRNNFYASSSLLNAEDNTMNVYFYNRVNGKLKNIVNNPIPTVEFYTDSAFNNSLTASYLSVSNPIPGVYKAQVALDTTASVIYDKWVNDLTTSIKYHSSSFDVYQRTNDDSNDLTEYIINISNLKPIYNQTENARFNIFVREKDWHPTIYTVAYDNIENTIIPNLYYKIFRFNDNYTVIDYSTGSIAYSKTSYDSNGNYFELNMNILEKDYGYGIKLATWDGSNLVEFKNIYKFRVE